MCCENEGDCCKNRPPIANVSLCITKVIWERCNIHTLTIGEMRSACIYLAFLLPYTVSAALPPRACFSSRDELVYALQKIKAAGSSAKNSTTAKLYGWPIGRWCTSSLTNFSNLFGVDGANWSDFNLPLDTMGYKQSENYTRHVQGADWIQPTSLALQHFKSHRHEFHVSRCSKVQSIGFHLEAL